MKNITPTYDRFFKALGYLAEKKGRGVQTFLAVEIGKSEGFVSSLLSGKKHASFDTQVALAEAFGYDYEELLALGRRLLSSSKESTVTEFHISQRDIKIEDLPSPECQFVENFSQLPADWSQFDKEFIAVPLVAHEVAAGQPIISRDYIEGWTVIHLSRLKGKKNLVAIRVKGRSMEPTIRDASIVCLDRDQREVVDGKIYAVAWDEGAVLKRVYKDGSLLQLVSDNLGQEFRKPISIDLKKLNYNPVIGKIVWAWVDFENDVNIPRRRITDF